MNPIPISYYQSNGAASECLQDAEREFLLAQGASEASNQDMWYEMLTSLNYEGALSDMMYVFWDMDGGLLGDDPVLLDTDELIDTMSVTDAWTFGG